MTAARDQIFAQIRKSLGREASAAEVDARIARHRRNLVPKRAQLPQPEQVALFERMATQAAATVVHVANESAVPEAVAAFLAQHNLPAEIRMAPDPALTAIPWDTRPTLTVRQGRAQDTDLTSVTGAIVGVAETGTLMLASGPAGPTTLNFLPDNHVVVLAASQVVGAYEDGWDALRARGPLPRTVNLITGPSRTGDIEQKIQLGAHGPRRLHIILIDGPSLS